jgi:class 3 adenylate cyclase
MKRSLITTLIIGVAATVLVSALHASKLIQGLETSVGAFASDYARATRVVSEKWQYVFVLVLALGAAWLGVSSVPRNRARLLGGFLLIELLGLSWVCSLYRVFFQPLPLIFAVVLAMVAAEGWVLFLRRDRSHLVGAFFANRLSKKELRRLCEGAASFDAEPKAYEVSVVACDIANKYALAEESGPVAVRAALEKFIPDIADRLLKEGAYLQAADGEGVVAIFGFPSGDGGHAEKAVRVALDLTQHVRRQRQNDGDIANCDIHLGISSGQIIAAPMRYNTRPALLTSGEPIELARRFCAANHSYGSNILIGTRTFDRVTNAVVARPIDFVNGVNSQDRHELYEPLWLAVEARPEHIARRDSFWSGVVLYREKRWAEAYIEFQKARGPEDEEDPPLQFYLRRLEPLALQVMGTLPE